MTEPLLRDDIIELLNSLGKEEDQEVLEAARQVHAKVAAADTTWEALLVPEGGVEAAPAETEDDDPEESLDPEPDDEEPEAVELPGSASEKEAEALALIEKMLAESGISEDFREELDGYKTDIAEGEFIDADHRYIRAVFKRRSSKS